MQHNDAGVEEANAAEQILATPAMVQPCVEFGCSLEEAYGRPPRASELQACPCRTSCTSSPCEYAWQCWLQDTLCMTTTSSQNQRHGCDQTSVHYANYRRGLRPVLDGCSVSADCSLLTPFLLQGFCPSNNINQAPAQHWKAIMQPHTAWLCSLHIAT